MIDKVLIEKIWLMNFGKSPLCIKRLSAGLCHFVFCVETDDDAKKIIRFSTEEDRHFLCGCKYWLERLSELKITIPKMLVDGTSNNPPFLILNYIPGKDLNDVYLQMSEEDKVALAKEMVLVQSQIEKLPQHQGYGDSFSYEDNFYKSSWEEVVIDHLNRSKKRILQNGIFDLSYVQKINGLIHRFRDYFSRVKPIPFLDDATTKNVLIQDWKLTGIIDIDWICFGDKLYQLACTRMALLKAGYDTNYVDYWADELALTATQRMVLDFYTLVFCVDFMSEIGMRFNKDKPLMIDNIEVDRLKSSYNSLYHNF